MRYIAPEIEKTLQGHHKMAFIAGPRQVGKTTLLKKMLTDQAGDAYFNWDVTEHREKILRSKENFWTNPVGRTEPPVRIGLDEIHKYPRWKQFLKGLYDQHGKTLQIIVTGSGRLDVYQRGGDSLFGRYYLFRLHPFTLGEFLSNGLGAPTKPNLFFENIMASEPAHGADKALGLIEKFSGFPEPLFDGTEETLSRWRRQHRDLVLREDLRDLSQIREIGLIDALVQMLPSKIGAPLSLNALREDLNVSFGAVKNWIDTLARLYFLFEIRPYTGKLSRALRREGKVYLYDPSIIENEGARFENVVALHLRKLIDAWNDFGHGDFDLHYVRNKEKKETDFLITDRQKPLALVEAKLSESDVDPSLAYFAERLKTPHALQVVRKLERKRETNTGKIAVISAIRLLSQI